MAPGAASNGREVEAGGWLLGLVALSAAITMAVSVPPPPGLDTDAYFIAFSGIFFAGVTQVVAFVWAADDGRRLAAGKKLVRASLVVPLLVAVGVSLTSLLQ